MHKKDAERRRLDELKKLYGEDLRPFAQINHARFHDPKVPYHVISRVFQGRFLLTPTPQLKRLAAGIIGRAQLLYPKVELFAATFMSNHIHLMLRGPAKDIPAFVGFVKREVSRRWGQEINWPGSMWDEYLSTALPTAASQVACLRYLLSHGVKEGLVARPEQWPGLNAAASLLDGIKLEGEWLDATAFGRAVRKEKSRREAAAARAKPRPTCEVPVEKYERVYEVVFSPLPAWSGLSAGQRQDEVRSMVDQIEAHGRHERGGRKPLGVAEVLRVPRSRRGELPTQPWFEDRRRMVCWLTSPERCEPEVAYYLSGYWTFQREFRDASRRYLAGELAVTFPDGAFRPPRFHSFEDRLDLGQSTQPRHTSSRVSSRLPRRTISTRLAESGRVAAPGG